MIGVYRIKNIITEDCYYGSSKNIEKRWHRHLSDLRKGIHHNIILQRAWDKYGECQFIFETVIECNLDELLIKEQEFLNLKPTYNIGLTASGGDNLTNHPNRGHIIEKISNSLNKFFTVLPEKERKKRFVKFKEKNYNWRGGTSKKTCKCGKIIGPNNTSCISCHSKQGVNNPFYGKKHTQETIDNLSKLNKGIYHGKKNIPIVIDGTEYSSYNHAGRVLGISYITIRWRVLSLNPKYSSYYHKNNPKTCLSKEEFFKKISDSNTGRKHKHNKPFTVDGVLYRTLKEASDKLGIQKMTIKGRILSNKFTNYRYA